MAKSVAIGKLPSSERECPDPYAEERLALARILESRYFSRAPLLSSFLGYVCDLMFQREIGRINEQEIGVNVFHRVEGYDPGEDNIVRNYARQLRRRLEQYYAAEGSEERLRIEIPKGGYVPVFQRQLPGAPPPASLPNDGNGLLRTAADGIATAAPPPIAPALTQPSSSWARGVWLTLAAFLICGITGYLVRQHDLRPRQSPLHGLWSQIFQKQRDTVVVPADVGFVVLQQLEHRTYTFAEYKSWSPVEQYDHVYTSFLKAQRYTSMLDLDTFSKLQRLPEVDVDRLSARSAHTLSMEDLSNDNIILLGSSFSNPWVEVFERNMNFRFVNDLATERFWIENAHPRPGESASYENLTRNITHITYAVIALLPNLNKTGYVLIVEGLDGPGTQAAVDMLVTGEQLNEVVKAATHPDGTLGSFEVLLTATSIDTHATGTRILATRYAQ